MAALMLLLLLLGLSGVCCDSHSLRFYETGVSSPGSGLPVYSVVAYVDDQEILSYSDDTRQLLPKAKWMEKFEREYWERETKRIRNNEPAYKRDVQKLMNRFNHTGGIHILQWMYGCELRDDGSTAGYMQDGYDGRDFNYLDTQRWIYVPMMDEAQILTQRWNSPEVKGWEVNKIYLENICTEYLKKFIEYGKEDLEKRVRPEVKVWAHQSDMVTTLHCLVYGFHPRAVEVTWVRNGTDHVISDEAGPILPHPDGTYQTRVIVEVPTAELDSYSCQVDHSSLGEILIVSWEPDNGLTTGGIVGVVITFPLVTGLIITGLFLYKRKKTDYRSTNRNATPAPPSLADHLEGGANGGPVLGRHKGYLHPYASEIHPNTLQLE